MKVTSFNRAADGFTLLECLVLIVIILVLLFVLAIPTKDQARRSTVVSCMNNQRQTAFSYVLWASDHNDVCPWRAAADDGGTRLIIADGDASQHLQLLSNYLLKPRVLVCPSDETKREAVSCAALGKSNLSYFVNLDATTNGGQIILTGDRHLQVNGQPVKEGLLVPGVNSAIEWTRELHAKNVKVPTGVMSFADGHAEAVKEKLTSYFQRQDQITNRLAIP